MQFFLSCLILILAECSQSLAWLEPQDSEVCPADVSQLSASGTSLLQGASHSYRRSPPSQDHQGAHWHEQKVTHKAHKSHKSRAHQKMSHDEDDDLLFEVKPMIRKPEAAKLQAKQRESSDNTPLTEAPQEESQSDMVWPRVVSGNSVPLHVVPQSLNTDAIPGKPMPSNSSQDATSSPTSSSITNKVEQFALRLAGFKLHVLDMLRGAPLPFQVAAIMTVVLGVVLLTALTLVVRRNCVGLDMDQEEALRPAPVDKLLEHSHAAVAKSGLLPKNSYVFCPELTVPEGSECVLKIPIPPVPDTGSDQDGGDSIFHIVDQEGKTCLCVRILSLALPGDGLKPPRLGERIVLMCPTTRVLAYCERHGSSISVFGHDDELFARLVKDETGDYSMVGRSGPLLVYHGQMAEGSFRVSDTEGRVLASYEKSDASDDIILRVAQLVDVGLIICGLLALDRMEALSFTLKG
eukprot:gnl/MRDRNA2_/MRDRNA2_118073_c0_seq1.p1 gnl/MRDRNA2_/MRDRNA2_118073_c0~~gnl/MRDRNA2_/MRDRNA2_118073_c0_seq1.p1  ORF type:complete len:464 (-),score=74.60 gnl/MRDRNA2_/MRDRNA2_118073_c0_seq1:23-1414(-)